MNSNNCEYVMAITKMPYPAWQSLKEKKKVDGENCNFSGLDEI